MKLYIQYFTIILFNTLSKSNLDFVKLWEETCDLLL